MSGAGVENDHEGGNVAGILGWVVCSPAAWSSLMNISGFSFRRKMPPTKLHRFWFGSLPRRAYIPKLPSGVTTSKYQLSFQRGEPEGAICSASSATFGACETYAGLTSSIAFMSIACCACRDTRIRNITLPRSVPGSMPAAGMLHILSVCVESSCRYVVTYCCARPYIDCLRYSSHACSQVILTLLSRLSSSRYSRSNGTSHFLRSSTLRPFPKK